MRLVKGHGTQNDFLLLADLDGERDVTPAEVRALCDRRAGLGADGVLRVVRTARAGDTGGLGGAAAPGDVGDAEFFMDYRNADGSLAEMCGNGIRVFLRYLQRAGLVGQGAAVATRGGIRRVQSRGDGNVTVHMGQPRLLADRPVVTAAHLPGPPRAGVAVLVPNPHVVVALDSGTELAGLDLGVAPEIAPPLPEGQNVEFVVRRGSRELAMRVHERGSGETRSCGTGICAAAVAVACADGDGPDRTTWTVDVPGGRCEVVWDEDGVELSGPAVLVADVDVDDDWLRRAAEQR